MPSSSASSSFILTFILSPAIAVQAGYALPDRLRTHHKRPGQEMKDFPATASHRFFIDKRFMSRPPPVTTPTLSFYRCPELETLIEVADRYRHELLRSPEHILYQCRVVDDPLHNTPPRFPQKLLILMELALVFLDALYLRSRASTFEIALQPLFHQHLP